MKELVSNLLFRNNFLLFLKICKIIYIIYIMSYNYYANGDHELENSLTDNYLIFDGSDHWEPQVKNKNYIKRNLGNNFPYGDGTIGIKENGDGTASGGSVYMEYRWRGLLDNAEDNDRWSDLINERRFGEKNLQSLLHLEYINKDLLQLKIRALKPGDSEYAKLTSSKKKEADNLDISIYEFYYKAGSGSNAIYNSTYSKEIHEKNLEIQSILDERQSILDEREDRQKRQAARQAAERIAEKAAEVKVAREEAAKKEAAEKEAAEKVASEKATAEKAAAEKVASEKAAAEKEAAEKVAAEKEETENENDEVVGKHSEQEQYPEHNLEQQLELDSNPQQVPEEEQDQDSEQKFNIKITSNNYTTYILVGIILLLLLIIIFNRNSNILIESNTSVNLEDILL